MCDRCLMENIRERMLSRRDFFRASAVAGAARSLVAAGLVVVAAGAAVLAGLDVDTDALVVGAALATCGCGLGVAVDLTGRAGVGRSRLVSARGLAATVGLAVSTAIIEAVEQHRMDELLDRSVSGSDGSQRDAVAGLLPGASHSLAAVKRAVPDVAVEVNEVARDALTGGIARAMAVVAVVAAAGVLAALRLGTVDHS